MDYAEHNLVLIVSSMSLLVGLIMRLRGCMIMSSRTWSCVSAFQSNNVNLIKLLVTLKKTAI